MKTITILVALLWSLSAAAAPMVPFDLIGKTSNGDECYLVVEEWSYAGGVESIDNLKLVVRTNWQKFDNPSVPVTISPTPWALYGINKATYDQFAVNFEVGNLDPSGITGFLFQTYSDVDGLIQQSCRMNK